MFGCVLLKVETTDCSFVSSAGETCQPFSVTVVTFCAFGAAARSVMACDPAATTDATRTTASRAGTISLLRMLPPPRLRPGRARPTPDFGALAPTPVASGIQLDLDLSANDLLVALECLPSAANIVFRRALVADREPEDVAAVQARVRQE